MTPSFSIIIPVYNVAPYLRECLDSVLAQTFSHWEAICVDDGSIDDSGSIMDEYANKDDRFVVVHKPNGGVAAARNTGLEMAKGKWICFLDADDVWDRLYLSSVSSAIRTNPDIACFRVGYEKFDDGKAWRNNNEHISPFYKINISKSISMRDFFGYMFFCHTYRKDLFDGIRFPRYIRGEDRCVLDRILLERVDFIVATETPLYGYRQRSGSAMNTIPSRQVLCDEMDHRLDIMEMIDRSNKCVFYAGSKWLEKYFTQFYFNGKKEDRENVLVDWRARLCRFRRMKGLSTMGRVVAWSCQHIRLKAYYFLVCRVVPWIARRMFQFK